jgi:hypothetical protein
VQIGFAENEQPPTELEVRFTPDGGGTLVELERGGDVMRPNLIDELAILRAEDLRRDGGRRRTRRPKPRDEAVSDR